MYTDLLPAEEHELDSDPKSAFNNNDDLFRDHIQELNQMNEQKNLQSIRNRKLRLINYMAEAIEREAAKEEERYEVFLNDLKKREIENNQLYRDRLIKLVMDDVDGKNPEGSAGVDPIEKPFQVLKNQALHERAVKDLTQSDFFQIEIDRLMKENDEKIENADKVLKKQNSGLNKRLEIEQVQKLLNEAKGKENPGGSKRKEVKGTKVSGFSRNPTANAKASATKQSMKKTNKNQEELKENLNNEIKKEPKVGDASMIQSYMSNPSQLRQARKKAVEDRQKLGKDKIKNQQSSLQKFENKKKTVNLNLKPETMDTKIEKAHKKLLDDTEQRKTASASKKNEKVMPSPSNQSRPESSYIKPILKNSTLKGPAGDFKPSAYFKDINLAETVENPSQISFL